jgi:hypothetical protein
MIALVLMMLMPATAMKGMENKWRNDRLYMDKNFKKWKLQNNEKKTLEGMFKEKKSMYLITYLVNDPNIAEEQDDRILKECLDFIYRPMPTLHAFGERFAEILNEVERIDDKSMYAIKEISKFVRDNKVGFRDWNLKYSKSYNHAFQQVGLAPKGLTSVNTWEDLGWNETVTPYTAFNWNWAALPNRFKTYNWKDDRNALYYDTTWWKKSSFIFYDVRGATCEDSFGEACAKRDTVSFYSFDGNLIRCEESFSGGDNIMIQYFGK